MATKSVLSQLVLGFSLLSLNACNFRDEKVEAVDTSVLPEVDPSELTFANVNATVLDPKCLGCHSAAAGNLGGINLEGYATVFALRAAVEDSSVSNRRMPQGSSLNTAQLSLLKAWLDAGAPE